MTLSSSNSRFEQAIKFVLEHEGGLEIDPDDPAGITKYGISLRFLRENGIDVNGDRVIDAETIRKLTIPVAETLYKKDFWDRYGYDKFIWQEISTKILDSSVNLGPSESHKLLQKAINHIRGKHVIVDGNLGSDTLAYANLINPKTLHEELRQQQKKYYLDIIAKHPAMGVFRAGWLKRASF